MLCYVLSGYQKMIQVHQSCARWCLSRAQFMCFPILAQPYQASLFDHLFNGHPHILLPLSLNFLTPSAVSASLKIMTRHQHASHGVYMERSRVALAPVSYQTRARKVLSPLGYCFPSGCPKEIQPKCEGVNIPQAESLPVKYRR